MIPREQRKREEAASWIIQRFMRGYQAKRVVLTQMTNARC